MKALGIEESFFSLDSGNSFSFDITCSYFVKMNPICEELERDVSVAHVKIMLNKVMHPP